MEIFLKKGIIALLAAVCCVAFITSDSMPFYPTGIARCESGILFSHKGVKSLDLYTPDGKKLIRSFPFGEVPTGVTADGNMVYVTTFETQGLLHQVDLLSGEIKASVPTGSGATSPLLSPDKRLVYVCNQFSNTISEVDIMQKKVLRTVSVLREPKGAVFSKDGKYLFVTNFLPAQRADVDTVASAVSVIETASFKKVKDILLANGSNALRGICITPDGQYIYVLHNLGRFQLPTSQLQQGWMNTSAFSVIDVAAQKYLGSVLVDEAEKGAAGVWDITCTDDLLLISHSGTHEISVIDHPAMRKKFEAYTPKENLDYDLTFLVGIRQRIPLEGNGPRKILLDGDRLLIPTYFSDILNVLDLKGMSVSTVHMNPNRKESTEDKGEKYFNDAAYCFQTWQSCNGCHPGDARTDGMNWDLMNDGIGNPKNCKSLLYSHVTPPNMISGIRAHAEIAVRAGFTFIQFSEIPEEKAECVDAYLKALRPVLSPYLVDGRLSEKAKQGRKVFEKENCEHCHNGPYFTDMKLHRIGDDIEFDNGWDTPTLIEVWRTSPYLFDGRAATMHDVFSTHKHGISRKLSKDELDALVEYVNSL